MGPARLDAARSARWTTRRKRRGHPGTRRASSRRAGAACCRSISIFSAVDFSSSTWYPDGEGETSARERVKKSPRVGGGPCRDDDANLLSARRRPPGSVKPVVIGRGKEEIGRHDPLE